MKNGLVQMMIDHIKKSKVVYAQISIKEKFALVKRTCLLFVVRGRVLGGRAERMLLTGVFTM